MESDGSNTLVFVPQDTESTTCPVAFLTTISSPVVSSPVPSGNPRNRCGVLEGICQNDFVLVLGLIKINAFDAIDVFLGNVRDDVREELPTVQPEISTALLVPLYSSIH